MPRSTLRSYTPFQVTPRDAGGETWYPEPRFSDWHVLAYPRSGTALLVVREDDDRLADRE